MKARFAKKREKRRANLEAAKCFADEIITLNSAHSRVVLSDVCSSSSIIDWDSLPRGLDPCAEDHTKLTKPGRGIRKRQQIESIVSHVLHVLENKTLLAGDMENGIETIVDFGAGTGHVGLILAWILGAKARIFCVDMVEKCKMGRKRLDAVNDELGAMLALNQNLGEQHQLLENVSFFDGGIECFELPEMTLGVSLHSCGHLTDLSLRFCLEHKAAFCFVPCCYGQLQHATTSLYTCDQASNMAKFADFDVVQSKKVKERTHGDMGDDSEAICPFVRNISMANPAFLNAKRCMIGIDLRRLRYHLDDIEDKFSLGYSLHVSSLHPLCCSPKNNVVMGWR